MAGSGSGTGTPISGGAVVDTATISSPPSSLLPLESFRIHTGYQPFQFWELSNELTPVTSACNGLVYQYAWQHADRVSRSEMQEALISAEQIVRSWLHFSIAPRYVTEILPYSRYVQLSEGYLQALGVQTLTLLSDEVDLTYTDADGDGVQDTFTATIATTATDASKVKVYFSSGDRESFAGRDDWQIAPVQVSISGGTATIKGRRWQAVRPILYEGVSRNPLDPNTDANFISTIAVYVESTTYEDATLSSHQCYSCDCPNEIAGTGSVHVKDAKLGIVEICTTGYCHAPDSVTISYLAGWPLQGGEIDLRWQKVITYLALAEIERPICAAQDNTMGRVWHRWQQDRTRAKGNLEEQFTISESDRGNPLGPRTGQIYAWNEIQHLRLMRGVFAG